MITEGSVRRGGSEAAAINDAGRVVGWGERPGGTLHGLCLDLSEGIVRYLGGTVESLATGSTRSGWPLDATSTAGSPTAAGLDAAVDAVTDLNADISEDAGWTVSRVWRVNDPGQVIGFGTAVIVGIYHQRGYLLTPRSTS